MTPELLQLITTGGAVGVLAVGFLLIIQGVLVTGRSADQRIDEVRKGGERLIGELTSSRDEWKKMAQDSIADVGQLGEALTVRNRIDEALTKKVDEWTKVNS